MRRLLVAALALAAVAVEAPSAQAAGGVYNVVKCHPWHLEADEIQDAGGHPSYGTTNRCNGTFQDRYIGIYNLGAAGNSAYKQLMYTAPSGTHIETACLDFNLRRDGHHQAEILAYPGFQVLAPAATAQRAGPTVATTCATPSSSSASRAPRGRLP